MTYNKKLIAVCTFIALIFILADFTAQKVILAEYRAKQLSEINNSAASLRAELESRITKNMLLIDSMASYIAINPELTIDEFNRYAAEVMTSDSSLLNLAAAPDYKISYVFPLAGNEKILGIDYRQLPKQWPDVELAVKTGQMVIAGPLKLLQGFTGIIGRIPVYIQNQDDKEMWGIVSSAINFDNLMSSVVAMAQEQDVSFEIINEAKNSQKLIFSSAENLNIKKAVSSHVNLPNSKWTMYTMPKSGWYTNTPYSAIIHLLSLLIAFSAMLFTSYKFNKDRLLAESERRFKDYTTSSSDWVWETNDKGQYTYTSETVKDLLGHNPEEMLGKSPFDFMSNDEAERVKSIFTDLIKNRKPLEDLKNWHITKDGADICVRTNGVPYYDINGQFSGYRGVDKDITDEVKAEEELIRNKELLDLFFSQSLDGFFFMMLDKPIMWNDDADKEKLLDYVFYNQRITKINRAMLSQYRADEKDFIGMTPADFFSHDIEGGRKVWKQFFDDEKMHINTTEKRFDGTEMIVEGDYICLHDADGRITGHFGIQRDVTVLKESQEKLSRYVKIVDENVITSQTDTRGDITYASKAFCEISGYSKEELIGHNHNIIRHPDMPDDIYEDLWMTIIADNTWHGELKNLKKDGGFYWVDTTVSPLINQQGEKYGYVAVRQDITAKKELERISITDRLTGVYNRMKIDSVIQTEHQRFTRYDESYALILMDIDKFKSVNDNYGHLVGDSVLKELAMLVPKHLRKTDVFGRWGGEEFLVICPHTDEQGAFAIAEKVRQAIESHKFEYVGKITSSFGTADITSTKDYDALIKLVDDMLYKAKHLGRNRVCSPSNIDSPDQ